MSSAMNFLRRIGTEPQSAPGQLQHNSTFPQQTPISATYAARTREPNAPENKYQVTQKCIYERRLPGGSYITAHLQRLQSGYYDTPIIHEDLIDNVRFVGINFVFHPSRSTFRFKSAEIRVALHNIWTDDSNPLKNATDILTGHVPDNRRHSHATQTSAEDINGHVIRYGDRLVPAKVTRPKFLRFAPHLLYGGISPETLDWNFNVAGSVGISQSGASASINPSGGIKGSYKVYEMMKIQGSMRTLRSWYNQQYDIEDGEIVWTLEENPLQKSGLPREFTFVMLLTKGSSNLEKEDIGDLTLGIDIKPKVAGFLGSGSFPDFVTNLRQFQPYRYPHVDLDLEIGQIFEPSEKGRGFNFSRLSSQFDDYVFLPGTTSSKNDSFMVQANQSQTGQQSPPESPSTKRQQGNSQRALPPTDPNTLNLRVFLENARGGSPIPLGAPISYLHLRPPSRNPSPLPPTSVSGSQRSHKRTITITSQQPSQSQSRNISSSSAATDRPRSQYDVQPQSRYSRPQRRHQSLRKTRSRSELNSEYNSSPVQERSSLSYDFRSSPIPEQPTTTHDRVTTARDFSPSDHIQASPARYRAPVAEEASQPQPDSQTLPQQEFPQRRSMYEAPILPTEPTYHPPVVVNDPPQQPHSGAEDTNEWQTPPETQAELQPLPQLISSNPTLGRSRPTSHIYTDPPSNLRTTEWDAIDDLPTTYHSKQTRTYHSHASQADTLAYEDPSHRQNHVSSVDEARHHSVELPGNTIAERNSGLPPSHRPFSYSPVREALNLAMAEQTSGLAPGATPSHGFGSAISGMKKAVSQPQPQLQHHSTLLAAAGGVAVGAGRTGTTPLSIMKSVAVNSDSIAVIPATPPLTIHKRDISTSSSMGEATGVWNDSPPDWTSPAIAQPRGSSEVSRAYSQRMGPAGVMEKSNTVSPAESVRRLGAGKGRTIRYSYPAANVGEGEGRYYRDRERRPVVESGSGNGNGRGEVLRYGDEAQERGGLDGERFAVGAV